jgi:predicted Co/Zn/Cd cation transporter (cation efflux family)
LWRGFDAVRTEQQDLKVLPVRVLSFSALGIDFGIVSGSFAIVAAER